jgi:hypothetical protein
MNRKGAKWIASAIGVVGLAPVSFLFGMTLLPSRLAAAERGTLIPWFLTWGFIWMIAVIAVSLAVFLLRIGMSQLRSE